MIMKEIRARDKKKKRARQNGEKGETDSGFLLGGSALN
jgi:hypothetical protein